MLRPITLMNPAMASAYRKGMQAHAGGQPITACPYGDQRTGRGAVTFSRAFIKAWGRGWKDAEAGLPYQVMARPRGLDDAVRCYTAGSLITVWGAYQDCKVDEQGNLYWHSVPVTEIYGHGQAETKENQKATG